MNLPDAFLNHFVIFYVNASIADMHYIIAHIRWSVAMRAKVLEYLHRGVGVSEALKKKIYNGLDDDHVKFLNLGHCWLSSLLPFVLQKINRVHFGLLTKADVDMFEAEGMKIPMSRRMLAVPFVGKDVPSRASEFSHPDVLIGLSILAFRYCRLK